MNQIPTKCESASGPNLIIFMRQCGERDQYTRLKLMDEVKIVLTSSKQEKLMKNKIDF
jgi:hypothetical protein